MMLDVARKKHCRHTATAELALDGVRGAKAGLELLTQQFWHQQIDESPTNRICTVRARTRLRRRGGRQQSRWHVQDERLGRWIHPSMPPPSEVELSAPLRNVAAIVEYGASAAPPPAGPLT